MLKIAIIPLAGQATPEGPRAWPTRRSAVPFVSYFKDHPSLRAPVADGFQVLTF